MREIPIPKQKESAMIAVNTTAMKPTKGPKGRLNPMGGEDAALQS
jgi:hypothetical protein